MHLRTADHIVYVPANWGEVSVEALARAAKAPQGDAAAWLAALLGVEALDETSAPEGMAARLAFLNTLPEVAPTGSFQIAGVTYTAPAANAMSCGQFVTAAQLLQQHGLAAMPQVLACLYLAPDEDYPHEPGHPGAFDFAARLALWGAQPAVTALAAQAWFNQFYDQIAAAYSLLFSGGIGGSGSARQFGWFSFVDGLAQGRILDHAAVKRLPLTSVLVKASLEAAKIQDEKLNQLKNRAR